MRQSVLGAGPILFVTYGNGHVAKVAPVVKALMACGVDCVVMALTLGYKQALGLGLQPVGYRDFLSLAADQASALAHGCRLLSDNLHPDVAEFESTCYLGINYAEWVECYGERGAADRYAARGRRGFLPVQFMGRVIDSLKPSLVVSTSSPRSEQAAIEAAVKRGIPSMTMMDLFALPHDIFLRQAVHADVITVLSGFAKDNLTAAGIDPARIVVTGCPAYDAMFDSANEAAGNELRHTFGWQDKKIVMWAGNLEEEGPGVTGETRGTALGLRVEERLRRWVEENLDAALIVRYHPAQYHLFPNLGVHPRVYLSDPVADRLQPQLHAADIIVVQTSTVGFEAALVGKRVLALSYSPMVINFDFDYGRLGLGESVSTLQALVPAIEGKDIAQRDRRAFPPDGPATPRVVEAILKLTHTI